MVGVVALKKKGGKKEERRGLGKRDVGPEGRKSRKMVALPQKWRSQKGKLAWEWGALGVGGWS